MPDALELALANAASNMPKGEELHIENLESIADPSADAPLPSGDSSRTPILTEQFRSKYKEFMQAQYENIPPASKTAKTYLDHEQDRLLEDKLDQLTSHVQSQSELTRLRLNDIADMISEISVTIQNAAQSMPQEPTLNHRSLEEWPDTTLLNELVNRENDLMPFYYELLKRIGSPELQSLVMSSMQGKNSSMVVLAQLCAALGSMSQPQTQYYTDTRTLTQEETASVVQRISQDPRFQSQSHVQAQSIPETGHQRLEQMNPLEQQQFAQQMNTVIPKSTYFETPPTYNPYFKER